jgi:hypothetical protein
MLALAEALPDKPRLPLAHLAAVGVSGRHWLLPSLVVGTGVPLGVVLARSSMSAYNSRVNHHGYAPVQLLTGAMPRMPSTLTISALVTDNARDEANTLRVHLSLAPNTQHAARAAFAAAETSARVRRAVNRKVRSRLLTEANLALGTDVLFFTHGLSKAG